MRALNDVEIAKISGAGWGIDSGAMLVSDIGSLVLYATAATALGTVGAGVLAVAGTYYAGKLVYDVMR